MNLIKDDIFIMPQLKVCQPYYVAFLCLIIFYFIFKILDLKAQTAKKLIEYLPLRQKIEIIMHINYNGGDFPKRWRSLSTPKTYTITKHTHLSLLTVSLPAVVAPGRTQTEINNTVLANLWSRGTQSSKNTGQTHTHTDKQYPRHGPLSLALSSEKK